MGQVIPYRSPRQAERTTALIGMTIFIGAWAMMFACLFFAYGALRLGAPFWPPAGQPVLPILVPGVNTLVIGLSSLAMEVGLAGMTRGASKRLAPALLVATLLGVGFLALQYAVGADLYGQGLTPRTGPYASVFYGLAGIHGLHVVIGVLALAGLTYRAYRGAYSPASFLPVRLWSFYWHFMGAVWALMFIFVFVV